MRSTTTIGSLFLGILCGCSLIGSGDDSSTSDSGAPETGSDGGGTATQLAVDCRDLGNLHDPKCTAPTNLNGTTLGTGPRFTDTLDVVHHGFVDQNRVVAALETASGGVILAVDVDTGNRTVISGPSVGTGTALPKIFDVQPGPDGWYALGNNEVWRVDPATGNRTKVWDSQTGPNCSTANASFEVTGIAVGPDKTIYLPVLTQSGVDTGEGIAAISGTTCMLVTHVGYPKNVNRGTGPDVSEYSQLAFRSNAIWFFRVGSPVGKIDPATGNRTIVSDSTPDTLVGTGPGIGSDSMAVSADAKTAWTACGSDVTYVSIDLSSGARAGRDPYNGPLSIGGPWCTVWAHPTKPLLVVEDANGFALYEPSTGNNNLLSY